MPKTTTEIPIIVPDEKWPAKSAGDYRCIGIVNRRWVHARLSWFEHHK